MGKALQMALRTLALAILCGSALAATWVAQTYPACANYNDAWCTSFCTAAPGHCPDPVSCCYDNSSTGATTGPAVTDEYWPKALSNCRMFTKDWCTAVCRINNIDPTCTSCCQSTQPPTFVASTGYTTVAASAATNSYYAKNDTLACPVYTDEWCTASCTAPGNPFCPDCCTSTMPGASSAPSSCWSAIAPRPTDCFAVNDNWCRTICEGGAVNCVTNETGNLGRCCVEQTPCPEESSLRPVQILFVLKDTR